MKKLFYRFFLIAGLLMSTDLSAQFNITQADGVAVNACQGDTPGITVGPSNPVVSGISGNYTVPSGLTVDRINIFHQYGDDFPANGGTLTSTNFSSIPAADYGSGTFSTDFAPDNSICAGEGENLNFIQMVIFFSDESMLSCYFFIDIESPCNPLPVELTFFKGKTSGNTNTLSWQTASEINNSQFEIERSTDGKTFEEIGKVNGNGNNVLVADYEFEDRNPAALTYYRLRQVDFDGRFEYSDIVSIGRRTSDASAVSVFPNPTTDVLNVSYFSEMEEELTITIVDITGRVVYSENSMLNDGANKLELNCNILEKGTYFLNLQSNNVSQSKFFVKQ